MFLKTYDELLKLRPPRLREGHVSRPRLLALLDRGLAQGLILISAPAGYGKTSLAVDWLAQRPFLTTAWLSLDETDNDLDLFLRYLTTAVRHAFPQEQPCANTQTLFNATQTPPLETVANALINDLAQLPHPLLLVLDDYHLITLPAIQQLLATLVRYLPDALQLLLITRVDPALPLLARRRAQQRLLEVRAADLRFTLTEVRAILSQAIGDEVDEATAVLLEEQTEGWIIGLQMAVLSLREQADPAASTRTFQERHHRLTMGFLFDEVLAHQPPAMWEFLLKTAVLERLCDPLCRAVVGPGSVSEGATLAHLAHSDLFLVPLDEQETWYRYHHLFRELLRRRLAQEWEPAEIAALHGRAGIWLAAQGFTEEALRHLLMAGDTATAATLIEKQRHELLNQGELYRLNRLLGLLPEDMVAQRPALLQLKAWVLRWQAKYQAIPILLQQAEALLAQETDSPVGGDVGESTHSTILRGERNVLRGEIAFIQNAFADSLAYTQSALDLLPRHYFYVRGLAALFHLLAQQYLGKRESAVRQLNEWLDNEQLQHPMFRFPLLVGAGGMYGVCGDLKRLEQVGQFMLTLGLTEKKPLSATWGHHFLAHVYYHWNCLDEAYAHWSAVLEWRYQANFRVYHEAMLGLALLHQTWGEVDQAGQTLDTLAQTLLEMNQVQFAPEVEAFRARLAFMGGDVGTTTHWVQSGTQPARLPLWYWETNELTRVKALLAQETAVAHQEATHLLTAGQQYAEQTANTWLLIQILALRALLAQAQGQTEEALSAAERAVRLAEPGGYLRLFVELGSKMGDLLAQLAKRGVAPAYIGRILAVFRTAPTADLDLTRREAEILALLQQGLSNKEIAGRLFLSVLTVKRHNQNIYQKLGVNGRRQAIAKAKTLNLLP